MKLSRFLPTVLFITLFSVLYVYQQTEIFRLAYAGQRQTSTFQDLLDKNSVLRYNINKNASLVNIGSGILSKAEFQMPDTYRLVRLASFRQQAGINQRPANADKLLSRLFGIKRQAEAKTISP